MKALAVLLVCVFVGVLGSIWSGYVLTILWAWFVVPVFSAPPISVACAIGLSLVVGQLTYQRDAASNEKSCDFEEALSRAIAVAVVYPAIALLVGWVVHFWV